MVSSMPRPHFNPGKDPVPILQEDWWAPGPVWTGGKSRSHWDSIPDRPARRQSLYRLNYPVHIRLWIITYSPHSNMTVCSHNIQGLSKRFEHLLLWPPRSPGLTPCDFFLWGYVKDNAYKPQNAKSHSNCGENH